MRVDQQFYKGEYGFYFGITSGIDLSSVSDGDVKCVFRKPDGTEVIANVPQSDWVDNATGQVNVTVPQGALDQTGTNKAQVVVKTASGVRPSHIVEFEVLAAAADNLIAVVP